MALEKRQGSANDPFTMLPLRVAFQGTPEEIAMMSGIYWLHFRKLPQGRDALVAILCTPDPDAPADDDRPRMSIRQLDRAISRSKKRGWLKTKKVYGGSVEFFPSVTSFSIDEADDAFFNFALLAKLKVPISPRWQSNIAHLAIPNSNRLEVDKNESVQPDQPPAKTPDPKRAQQAQISALLDRFKEVWEDKHPGEIYIKGMGDRKLCLALVEAGVTVELIDVKARVWIAKADAYTKEKMHPFWLFVRAFNSVKIGPLADDDGPGKPSI